MSALAYICLLMFCYSVAMFIEFCRGNLTDPTELKFSVAMAIATTLIFLVVS